VKNVDDKRVGIEVGYYIVGQRDEIRRRALGERCMTGKLIKEHSAKMHMTDR
jgi:hypothetical protein